LKIAHVVITFYRLGLERMPECAERLPTFDARVWNVPNRAEGADVFLWREWDPTKNSVSMVAAAYYGLEALSGNPKPLGRRCSPVRRSHPSASTRRPAGVARWL
jgi:hypothetical protein